MSRILLLGGYGGFGSRIALRLAADGHDVLVAGRSLEKAERFCRGRPKLTPLELDRDRDLEAALRQHEPDMVVDAAGPFQGASYAVPRACIAAGCNYLDIADGRDFVSGICVLDDIAKAAGLTIVSGASSVPALSGAVVRRLAAGFGEVRAIEMAISASNRATAGGSVTRAILSYVGRPLKLWRGRRWATGFGWQDLGRDRFEICGISPLSARLVALADVPDLSLLPSRVAGTPSVKFRAGTEMAVHNLALWLASWLVRWGWIARLGAFAPAILRLLGLTRSLGSDRSGMIVRLFGIAAGRRLERRWTLIAGNGAGPEIPTLAIPLLVGRITRGEIGPGAYDAGPLLDLDAFEPAFQSLGIRHETVDIEQPAPLYAQVLGPAFDRLPPAVRAMHDVLRDGGASGRATVVRGGHPLARFAALLFGFPPAGEHELHVGFEGRNGGEIWTRDFSGNQFTSRLSRHGGHLVEHFGPLRFGFRLEGDRTGLTMHVSRWWLGPLPMPLALAPRSLAREWEEGGRFHFDVPIALPLIGPLVHYRGWLVRVPDGDAVPTPAPEALPR